MVVMGQKINSCNVLVGKPECIGQFGGVNGSVELLQKVPADYITYRTGSGAWGMYCTRDFASSRSP